MAGGERRHRGHNHVRERLEVDEKAGGGSPVARGRQVGPRMTHGEGLAGVHAVWVRKGEGGRRAGWLETARVLAGPAWLAEAQGGCCCSLIIFLRQKIKTEKHRNIGQVYEIYKDILMILRYCFIL